PSGSGAWSPSGCGWSSTPPAPRPLWCWWRAAGAGSPPWRWSRRWCSGTRRAGKRRRCGQPISGTRNLRKGMDNMAGTLYLVATLIGSLGGLSLRALETLEAVDFIAAEDTRVSVKLLRHFSVRKPLVSYHQANQHTAGPSVLQRLLGGE